MCTECWGPDAKCDQCGAVAREMRLNFNEFGIPVGREFYCNEHAAELERAEMMERTAPWN